MELEYKPGLVVGEVCVGRPQLPANERLLREARIGIPPSVWIVSVMTVFLMGLGLLILVFSYLSHRNERVWVTDKRVIHLSKSALSNKHRVCWVAFESMVGAQLAVRRDLFDKVVDGLFSGVNSFVLVGLVDAKKRPLMFEDVKGGKAVLDEIKRIHGSL